jgi:uncharacterized protein YjbI with pentapeptide repeats
MEETLRGAFSTTGCGLTLDFARDRANLNGANLTGADFREADLFGANLLAANLRRADRSIKLGFQHAQLVRCPDSRAIWPIRIRF